VSMGLGEGDSRGGGGGGAREGRNEGVDDGRGAEVEERLSRKRIAACFLVNTG
jgi:hypothetical protein